MLQKIVWILLRVFVTLWRLLTRAIAFASFPKRSFTKDRSRVVVIGGGFAGAFVAKDLQEDSSYDVTLITPHSYFDYTPGAVLALTHPEYKEFLEAPFTKFLSNTHIQLGSVRFADDRRVIVDTPSGEQLSLDFDFLVCASGRSYQQSQIQGDIVHDCMTSQSLSKACEQAKSASSILIIGGGLVGIELAAELKRTYGDNVFVNVVHAESFILNRLDRQIADYVEAYFYQNYKAISLLCDRRIVGMQAPGEFVTHHGETIQADIAFVCAGCKPNTSYLRPIFNSCLTDSGYVRVNSCLQMNGFPNIFAAGDIASLDEEKMAAHSRKHASVISENIHRLVKSRHDLISYLPRSPPEAMILSLGAIGLLIYQGKMVWHGRFPILLKGVYERAVMMSSLGSSW
eukprot:TRINITY_DN5449_c0_g1_i2.p1 TRINITY_DN5449_c0_g1~~TRINITY_DN5449_c0_g1_i2.p1  ORF type:complete len:400 (-),score=73.34 TRINITY_DN5449_c0_g1_i2:203-1402(-)